MASWAFALRRSVAALMIGFAIAAVATVAAPASPQLVAVHSTENRALGEILVSASGRTLYHISAEPKNVVRCTGACAVDWPPFVIPAGTKPAAGPGVRASLLGTIRRGVGKLQVTYAGMPLYLYSGDRKAGRVNGQGVGGVAWLGGTWHAVSPSGSVVSGSRSVTPIKPAAATSTDPDFMNC
ncbi:MAG TPA: hypothetical protein VH475_13510 [Tepidisphaeraceae bacterium]